MISLKEATVHKHTIAEQMLFNKRLMSGQLSEQEYLIHLQQQFAIFQTLEKTELPHPSLLRSAKVQQDIDELCAKGIVLGSILESTKSYTSYLDSLRAEQVLPHIYLNYMAVLFGGQMMKSKVPSKGRMYEVDNFSAAIQSIRAIQKDEWADEVEKGYDFIISIFAEMETVGEIK